MTGGGNVYRRFTGRNARPHPATLPCPRVQEERDAGVEEYGCVGCQPGWALVQPGGGDAGGAAEAPGRRRLGRCSSQPQEEAVFSTILIPLDGSPLAERALPYAERLARAGPTRLVLTRAVLARVFPGT